MHFSPVDDGESIQCGTAKKSIVFLGNNAAIGDTFTGVATRPRRNSPPGCAAGAWAWRKQHSPEEERGRIAARMHAQHRALSERDFHRRQARRARKRHGQKRGTLARRRGAVVYSLRVARCPRLPLRRGHSCGVAQCKFPPPSIKGILRDTLLRTERPHGKVAGLMSRRRFPPPRLFHYVPTLDSLRHH